MMHSGCSQQYISTFPKPVIMAFLDEVIPFADKEEGTVYEHLKRAVDFSMNHLGVARYAGRPLCRLE